MPLVRGSRALIPWLVQEWFGLAMLVVRALLMGNCVQQSHRRRPAISLAAVGFQPAALMCQSLDPIRRAICPYWRPWWWGLVNRSEGRSWLGWLEPRCWHGRGMDGLQRQRLCAPSGADHVEVGDRNIPLCCSGLLFRGIFVVFSPSATAPRPCQIPWVGAGPSRGSICLVREGWSWQSATGEWDLASSLAFLGSSFAALLTGLITLHRCLRGRSVVRRRHRRCCPAASGSQHFPGTALEPRRCARWCAPGPAG